MVMSGRPSTSRARDLMMHLRGSLGSEMEVPPPSPRDAFQRLRDSSFWSRLGKGGCVSLVWWMLVIVF